MNMNDLKMPDLEALVAFGKMGVKMLASRAVTLLSLLGLLSLGGYAVYASSWQGVVVVAILALLVFRPALAAETGQRDTPAREE